MKDDFQHISIDTLCQVIDLFRPTMDDYLYVYDFVNDFYYISPHATQRFSLPGTSFHHVVENHGKFVYPPDADLITNDLNEILSGKKSFHNLQYRWLDTQGHPVWINCRGYVVRENGRALYMAGCINEIGAKQKADNVSGLLGESSLISYLEEFPSTLPKGFFLRLGLDDFKAINDNLGQEFGDRVLWNTAKCISECTKPWQKLYRLIADEFVVVDFEGGTVDDAQKLYQDIRNKLFEQIQENQYEAIFTISAGILDTASLYQHKAMDVIKLSDFAMNEAKRLGKNQSYLFQQERYELFLRRQRLEKLLREAVIKDFEGFEAYFQPIFQQEPEMLYGAETLLRFHTLEYGMISPGEFVPILEETGLIIPVGRWVLNQALEKCKKIIAWRPSFKITFNVSHVQVAKSDVINDIINAVAAYHIPPGNVVVELTESGELSMNPRFSKLWAKLKAAGILLALDDFGTGSSNFHYLHNLRPDILKIDREFTCKSLEEPYEFRLLALISEMGHSLNLRVCVEGIETASELDRIQGISPDFIQGYYFGRPVPYDQFLDTYILH